MEGRHCVLQRQVRPTPLYKFFFNIDSPQERTDVKKSGNAKKKLYNFLSHLYVHAVENEKLPLQKSRLVERIPTCQEARTVPGNL